MKQRTLLLTLALVLLLVLVVKQNWYPVKEDSPASLPAPAVNAEMQQAFADGQGVWLVFFSDT